MASRTDPKRVCLACGYDLSQAVVDRHRVRCPECGETYAEQQLDARGPMPAVWRLLALPLLVTVIGGLPGGIVAPVASVYSQVGAVLLAVYLLDRKMGEYQPAVDRWMARRAVLVPMLVWLNVIAGVGWLMGLLWLSAGYRV